MSILIKGSEIASQIKPEIKKNIDALIEKGIKPALAAVRVGNKPDAVNYERSTTKFLSNLNIDCRPFYFEEDIDKDTFLKKLREIDKMPDIHGILLFRPIPEHLECRELEYAISAVKDIDGMNPLNFGLICANDESGHAPCTAEAVMKILKFHNIEISGKNAVVIGRSMVIGKPAAMLLLNESATVTVCHSKTANLKEICTHADILVAAIGRANFVSGDFVKPGAVVIDVGININEEGKLTGDVNFEEVSQIAGYITPVPGGVGSVTNAVLAEHIVKAAKYLSQEKSIGI
ncbi:MAG: bifunctional 5,10-methylene-tetrahydrofolate dehydrogenase/5,10-methylene-tetrahydrofolate cyclohydrolase [Clostridiales bacterium]|jgi:methylenetetrahydrofolate dehydrogenase (NADP+)/methenyltetrahydrofolate cyclohydrolase|nr:bifunctional 5,10-methylene-tetrahydrofolate dehydrogenase/5,10-methylene-tetrahydrofolate cyclohydrolase [Clostridiales bacterium]